MAPPDVPPIEQTLPFEVRIIRWWKSGVIWVFIAGLVMNVGPLVLAGLGSLSLTSQEQFWYSVIINAALYGAGIYIHNQSTAVVGSKSDVTVAQSDGTP